MATASKNIASRASADAAQSVDEFLACGNAACGVRFPGPPGMACPFCRGRTEVVAKRYANVPLRRPPQRRFAMLLDNVRSAHNVGVMLRTAEAVGVTHCYCVGITAPGSHPKVAKAALGAEQRVPHSYHGNGVALAETLARAGAELWALECVADATELASVLSQGAVARAAAAEGLASPLVLVLGNEVTGVDPGLLARCARICALPMVGEKNSLNVGHAFAVAAYAIAYGV